MNAPKFILLGGCGLAFGAAFANTGFLLETGTSVSHLTGDVARMTMSIARWSPVMLVDLLRVVVAAALFFVGAALAGYVIHHPNIDLKRPYGRTIISIGCLFVVSALCLARYPIVGIGLAAFACGLQNALATHYRGVVLRTTHLTGLMTDFGVAVGMRMRGYDVPAWKMKVPAMLMVSFFIGGGSAAYIHLSGYDSIMIAGTGYVAAGIAWSIRKHVRQGVA